MYSADRVAKRLTEILDGCGKSLNAIERETGIPHSTLSQWKNGKHMPRLDMLTELSVYLDFSLDYIVGKSEY